jgi:TRAP-type C4-dicarboxylate transport system substrate-binding protein
MKRKMISIGLAVLISLCGASAALAAITLNFSGQGPVDHMATVAMKEIAEEVFNATNGEVVLKIFPANQLGDYTLVYEEISKGTIDMALCSISPQFDARHQVTLVPYLASNYEQARAIFDPSGWLAGQLSEIHDKLDVKYLGIFMDGFGGIGTTKESVSPLDPTVGKSVICRIPNIEIAKIFIDSMGYRTVSVPYADLYTAMQTGVCEGWWGGTANLNYLSFRDVIKYYYALNTYIETEQFIVSKRSWDKLNPEQQKILQDSVAKAAGNSFAQAEREDKEFADKMAEYGIEVQTYTAEQLKPTVRHIREVVWPRLGKLIGEDLVDNMIKNIAD